MTEELNQKKCAACSGDLPPISEAEIEKLKPQIPDWHLINEEGLRLQRVYLFSDFKQALDFTQKIGEKAEQEGHHPALLTEWGKVTVTWWTHSLNGLHENDFIMASKSDRIAKELTT